MSEEIKEFLDDKVYVLVYRSNYDRALEVNQKLIDYIKNLQRENQQLEQENQQLKKQKDDVVEYIKTTTYSGITGLKKHNITEFWFIKDLLRMLGEIND